MFFAISVSSLLGFMLVELKVKVAAILLVSSGCTFINLILLYFLDDTKMIRKSANTKDEEGARGSMNSK